MNTTEILKNLIERLYSESLKNGLNFNISIYDTAGKNYLTADDGTFLGSFSNQYDSKSIFNSYSLYGSKYSALSPINPYTATPPKIFINDGYFGKLTTNKYLADAKPTDVFLFYVLNKMNLLDLKLDDFIELTSRI